VLIASYLDTLDLWDSQAQQDLQDHKAFRAMWVLLVVRDIWVALAMWVPEVSKALQVVRV
jgi:hypothetical protein